MQIHISWKALLAGLIFLIAIVLIGRVTAVFFGPEEQAATTATAARAPTAMVVAALDTPTVAAPTATPSAEAAAPTATTSADVGAPGSTASVEPATATSSPSPTASPEPTLPPASPTPFQPPTRIPTPVPQPVIIIAQGYGQRQSMMSYAFVVSNPNPDLLAQGIRYQIAVYNDQGIVLTTDVDTIDSVGPGQSMGVAKELNLAPSQIISRMEVLLRPGQFVQSPPLTMLPVSNTAYIQGAPPQLTGVVTNPLGSDLADLEVVGIAYDDVGVIGGGTGLVPFLPSGGQVAVSVPVVVSQPPTRIEFYITVASTP